MKAIACVLLALAAVAFAQELCKSTTFSYYLTYPIPLADENGYTSLAEINQRFDISSASTTPIYIAINCVKFYLDASVNYNTFDGYIVVRDMDPVSQAPRNILYRAKTNICPYAPGWYVYDEAFRVTIPAQNPINGYRSFYIGYQSESTGEMYPIMYAANLQSLPQTAIWFGTNLTNAWQPLYSYYSHIGIDADIVTSR